MIKPHRNQIKINVDKVNRHSSQLAIRKASCQSTTSRDQEAQLRNIRQTTFWMKKTVGVSGVENLHPNGRRICPSRSRQVFSMKVNTDHSETDSACLKKIEEIENSEIHPKLNVLQKAQIETGAQVSMVINQNLPKLGTCNNLLNSLNKTIKLAYKTMSKVIGVQLERMLDQHIQLTTLIFQKVLNHSNDFIQSQKCSHLIAKTIEQEKQNSKLMGKCAQLSEIIEKIKNPCTQKKQQIQINLKSIDLQRIITANYRVGEYAQLTNAKINQICKQILKPVIGFGGCLQIGYFEVTNWVVSRLAISKQGGSIIKLIGRKDKNKDVDQQNSFGLSLKLVNIILKSTLNFQIFNLVKKKLLRFMNTHKSLKYEDNEKIDMKTTICFINKLSILKDKTRQKQILINLLALIQVADRQKSPTETQLNQISTYIEEDYAQINKRSALSDKVNRLNNKRLVNCANLYQKKKKKNGSPQKQENANDFNEPEVGFKSNLDFYLNDVVILSYFYLVNQLEYLAHSARALVRFDESNDSGCCLRIVEKLVNERFAQMIRNSDSKEKSQIFQLSWSLAKAYGEDSSIKQECKQETLKQLLKLANADILKVLGEEKRLVLSQLANEVIS